MSPETPLRPMTGRFPSRKEATVITSNDAQRLAQAELETDERLLWCGQPDPMRTSVPVIPIALFGVPCTLISIGMVAMGIKLGTLARTEAGGDRYQAFLLVFTLVGVLFVLIGLGLITMPWWLRRKMSRLIYVATDRRGFIFDAGRSHILRTMAVTDVGDIEYTERQGGTGDLIISHRAASGSRGEPSREAPPLVFIGVPDVQSLERLLRETWRIG